MPCLCRVYAVSMPCLCRVYAVSMPCVSFHNTHARAYANPEHSSPTQVRTCSDISKAHNSTTHHHAPCAAQAHQHHRSLSRNMPCSSNACLALALHLALQRRTLHTGRNPCKCEPTSVRNHCRSRPHARGCGETSAGALRVRAQCAGDLGDPAVLAAEVGTRRVETTT